MPAAAKPLGLGWDKISDLAVSKIRILVCDQPGHLKSVRLLGVDEEFRDRVKIVTMDGFAGYLSAAAKAVPAARTAMASI